MQNCEQLIIYIDSLNNSNICEMKLLIELCVEKVCNGQYATINTKFIIPMQFFAILR